MKYMGSLVCVGLLLSVSPMIYAAAPSEIHNSETIASQLVSQDSVRAPHMVTGSAIVGLLKEMVDFELDGSSVVFHRKTGKLFVKNTPKNQESVQNVLKQIRDYKPQQVMIEARIVEVTSFEGMDIGVDWTNFARSKDNGKHALTGSSDLSSGNWGDTSLNPLNQLNLAYGYLSGTDTLDITLRALEQDGRVNTLSAPKVICFNNQRSNIKIEESTDYVSKITTTTVYTNDNPNVESSAEVETAVEGIVLDVTPTIDSESENIMLDLHPTVVELVSLESVDLGASGTIRVPKYVRRTADTTVSVKDGGTVVLGGMMKRTKSKEIRRIPVLGHIPLIKRLFSAETEFEQKFNLMIFITAKIIES